MKYIFFVGIIFMRFSVLAGGPWLQEKRKAFIQTQFTLPIGSYNRLFLENGNDLILNADIIDTHWQNYLEYGINNKLNFIGILPVKYVSSDNGITRYSLTGFSNISLGLKFGLTKKKWASAFAIMYNANTTKQDLINGLSTGYPVNFTELKYYIGRGFGKGWYAYSELGIRKFLNYYSDSWLASVEVGKELKNNRWLAVVVASLQSFHNSTANYFLALRQTGLYVDNQEYVAYGVKFAKEYHKKFGFNISTFGALSGNYVAHLATANLGIYWKLLQKNKN